ncbi:MAG: sulfotransferase [Steroidobacterales bacterium]
MLLEWFNAREAAAIGAALADQFAPKAGAGSNGRDRKGGAAAGTRTGAVQDFLRRAEREVRNLRLNFFKRAKLANSFKWRLLENGAEQQTADDVTQALLMHLLAGRAAAAPPHESADASAEKEPSGKQAASPQPHLLLAQGNKCFAEGAYAQAADLYGQLVELKPRHADALNNLGATLCKLSRYQEAEDLLRRALKERPNYPEAHSNLGGVQRWKGLFTQAEASFRRALKLKPTYVNARSLLGLTLAQCGRTREAEAQLEKVLTLAPQHIEALLGLSQVATVEGRFEEAGALFKRVLEISPQSPEAWVGLVSLRKMTSADGAWLEGAQKIAASGIGPVEEASVRFAIGKYYDDTGAFERAFESYKRGNELLKARADRYRREAHTQFVDDLIRSHTRASLAQTGAGASASERPVFVVGMARSGTSLAEQILASHPGVFGAGELGFWSDAGRKYEAEIRRGVLSESIRKTLAEGYLRTLDAHAASALRVVNKTPSNADYLGVIHSVFPKARIIYMQRDPIDTCLSCYFQEFTQALNFTMDLSDLAHYYLEHQRLMAHWRSVLPAGSILDVPYEELVAEQEQWTRRMLSFMSLEWDPRCLDFHKTNRAVATASSWQVRQLIYQSSVHRWRNYQKFIGPLLRLKDMQS